jgi:hypothetical protein
VRGLPAGAEHDPGAIDSLMPFAEVAASASAAATNTGRDLNYQSNAPTGWTRIPDSQCASGRNDRGEWCRASAAFGHKCHYSTANGTYWYVADVSL